MDEFRVLGNNNRRNILQILMKKNIHIAEIARELNISNPVALKHVLVLEEVGLIEREKIGNTHVLKIKKEAVKKIKQVFNLFEKSLVVKVSKGTSLLEALRMVSGLKIEKSPDGAFISEIDGKKGYYAFEVNGKFINKPADQLELKKDCEIDLKRLMPIIGKKILIKVK